MHATCFPVSCVHPQLWRGRACSGSQRTEKGVYNGEKGIVCERIRWPEKSRGLAAIDPSRTGLVYTCSVANCNCDSSTQKNSCPLLPRTDNAWVYVLIRKEINIANTFLADRTNGCAYATALELVCRLSVTHVLWLNGASSSKSYYWQPGSKGPPIEMACGKSNVHVTDDITWPSKVKSLPQYA